MSKRFLIILLIIIFLVISFVLLISLSTKNKSENIIKQGCSNKYCEKFFGSEESSERTIDILFIPADVHYGGTEQEYIKNSEEPLETYQLNQFKLDISEILETLFSLSPYDEYQNKFNLYYYKKNAKCYIDNINYNNQFICSMDDKDINSISLFLSDLGYFDFYVILEPGDGGGTSGVVIYSKKTPLVVIHELSHNFQLYDEDFNGGSLGGKVFNVCNDFSCCGGRLCVGDENGECCVQIIGTYGISEDIPTYTVPYDTVMRAGHSQGANFSQASIKMLNCSLKNYRDSYSLIYNKELNKEVYVPNMPKFFYLDQTEDC